MAIQSLLQNYVTSSQLRCIASNSVLTPYYLRMKLALLGTKWSTFHGHYTPRPPVAYHNGAKFSISRLHDIYAIINKHLSNLHFETSLRQILTSRSWIWGQFGPILNKLELKLIKFNQTKNQNWPKTYYNPKIIIIRCWGYILHTTLSIFLIGASGARVGGRPARDNRGPFGTDE